MKKTVVFDFDGVIHSYTSGWQGAVFIPDPPVPGIREALKAIHEDGYEIVIVSTRCSYASGIEAVNKWLSEYDLLQYIDKVCMDKPPAIVYIDDRAICFDGRPDRLLEKIKTFKPWNQIVGDDEKRVRKLNNIQKREKLNDVYPIGVNGPGGAYHDFAVVNAETQEILASIEFQKGPRKDPEARHGVLDDDLLEMVRDRLKAFQKSGFACEENAHALLHVEEALMWLNRRKEDRLERGVLGTYNK